MSERNRPIDPVGPNGVELVFFYPCPHCGHSVPLVAPVQPATVRCDACSRRFPIIPVDERAQRYFKVVTNNGRACIDPDFA